MANEYDVLIIGGGHAGLSAGLTLYRHLHRVLIFDTGKPRDAWHQPTHVVSGWEGRQANELRVTGRAELISTGLVDFEDEEAVSVERAENLFVITTVSGKKFAGKKLLIAVGSQNVFPSIPGYSDNYPELM
jgi:gliotoxin/aspirochlorine biosynthesis thioredoxin reductase